MALQSRDRLCTISRNFPFMSVSHHCLWTAYKDDTFNLVVVCVNLVTLTHATNSLKTTSLSAVYKQRCTTEIKESFLNDMQKLSLGCKAMLKSDGKLHVGIRVGCCCLFYRNVVRNKFNWESQLPTHVV